MDDKRLSELLETWRDWCRIPSHDLGYPRTAAGIRYRTGADFEAMCESMDERLAQAVDVSVDELPLAERTAVHAVVLGPMVWRLREPIQDVFERARAMLKIRLNGRGVE